MEQERTNRTADDVAKQIFEMLKEESEESDADDSPQNRDKKSEEKKLRDSVMANLSDEAKLAINADNAAIEDIIAKLKTKTIQKEQGMEMTKFKTIGNNTKSGRGL
jgi:aminoglycoside phosphotransferase